MKKEPGHHLLIAAIFLLVFVVQFLLRATDDNSLFSWAWAFAKIDATRIYLFLILGLIISSFLSRTAIPDAYQMPLLAALSCAAALPFWSESEIIVDASRYFTQAKHLEVYGIRYFMTEWGRAVFAWTDLPLVPFLFGLIFTLFGESRIAIQLFTTLLFSLTTVLTYLVGKTLWDRETGFSGGLLLLGIPYLLTQVPLMLVDIPTMFFLMLAIFTFLNALNWGGIPRIGCSVAAIVCTVLSKYSSWFMLTVLAIVLVVYAVDSEKRTGRRPLLRGSVILLIAASVSGAVLFFQYDVVAEQIQLLREYQKPGLSRWGESLHSTFLFQVHPFITAAAAVSVALAVRKRDMKHAIISWLVLLLLLFGIRRIRYTLSLFPLFTLMAAYGLQIIKREESRRFITYGIVSSSLVIAVFAFLPLAESMSAANLKLAGAYLNSLTAEEIEVITLPPREPVVNHAVSVPLLDLFTDKHIRYRYVPEAFPPPEEIGRSSLRFTWEYQNPAYYEAWPDSTANAPLIILSDASDLSLPTPLARRLNTYRLSESFSANEGIFRYTVGVRVYQKMVSPL